MTGARVILVGGSPRSGTTALFDLLGSDPRVVSHHEPDGAGDGPATSPWYVGERLRPASHLRGLLAAAPGPVLLRANEELPGRTLDDCAADFADHDVSIVWIYRAAAKVLGSAVARGWWEPTPERLAQAIDDWNLRNTIAASSTTDRLEIVSYHDLTADKELLGALADRLGLRVRGSFGADQGRGLASLPAGAVDEIERRTAATFADLEARRTRRARPDARAPVAAPAVPVVAVAPADGLAPAVPRPPGDLAGLVLQHRPGTGTDSTAAEDGLVRIGGAIDLGFLVRGEWTFAVVVRLPGADRGGWSPIVQFGSPVDGEAGGGLVWLGPDTDERPTPGPGGGDAVRAPGSSLLLGGVTGVRSGPPTSASQIGPVVKQAVDRSRTPTVAILRHRWVDSGSEVLLVVDGVPVAVRADRPDVPSHTPAPEALVLGGQPGQGAVRFAGVIEELALYDRALSDVEIAALTGYLERLPSPPPETAGGP